MTHTLTRKAAFDARSKHRCVRSLRDAKDYTRLRQSKLDVDRLDKVAIGACEMSMKVALFMIKRKRESQIKSLPIDFLFPPVFFFFILSIKMRCLLFVVRSHGLPSSFVIFLIHLNAAQSLWWLSCLACTKHNKNYSFNNRVLRLPAVVLLNTMFRPGNSGLLRLYV